MQIYNVNYYIQDETATKQPKCQGWGRETSPKIPEEGSDVDDNLSVGILRSQSWLVVCSPGSVGAQVSLGWDIAGEK